MVGEPVVTPHAPTALTAETMVLSGARRYHWPATGKGAVCPSGRNGSSDKAVARRRRSGTAHSTSGCAASCAANWDDDKPLPRRLWVRSPRVRPSASASPSRSDSVPAWAGRTAPPRTDSACMSVLSARYLTITRAEVGSSAGMAARLARAPLSLHAASGRMPSARMASASSTSERRIGLDGIGCSVVTARSMASDGPVCTGAGPAASRPGNSARRTGVPAPRGRRPRRRTTRTARTGVARSA